MSDSFFSGQEYLSYNRGIEHLAMYAPQYLLNNSFEYCAIIFNIASDDLQDMNNFLDCKVSGIGSNWSDECRDNPFLLVIFI